MQPLKRADIVRHAAIDDLGSFRPILEARGYDIVIHEPFADDLGTIDVAASDLMIVLGGAIGVNDEPHYPFLGDEIRLVERRLRSGRPLVGVCLGAQIIAKAAGKRVYSNASVEFGYLPVTLTEAGQQSCLTALGDNEHRIMHWHYDAFELPDGAVRLAYTELTPNQAFTLGDTVLGVQFHMEADPRTIGGWTVAYIGDIQRSGISLPALRAEVARQGEAAARAGGQSLGRWLDALPPGA